MEDQQKPAAQEPLDPVVVAIQRAQAELAAEAAVAVDAAEPAVRTKGRTNAERQAAWRARHAPKKLEQLQQEALAALPEPERQRLLALQDRCAQFRCEIAAAIRDIEAGKIAGLYPVDDPKAMAWPDQLFRELKEFIAESPLTNHIPDYPLHYLPAEEQAQVDDEPYVLYGLKTRMFVLEFDELCRVVLAWANQHPGDCDEDVMAELKSLGKSNFPPPYDDSQRPRFQSEAARQGIINAAEQQKEQQRRLEAEQMRFRLRQLGLSGDADEM